MAQQGVEEQWLSTRFYQPGFWIHNSTGETNIAPDGLQGPFNQWQQTNKGLYYLRSGASGPEVWLRDQQHNHRLITAINSRELPGFNVSPDSSVIYFTDVQQQEADIMYIP